MEEELEQLKQTVQEQQEFIDSLKNSSTIPYDVRVALASGEDELSLSSKASGSENRAVDEAGASTYNVLNAPDGFLEVVISDKVYYLPYFN